MLTLLDTRCDRNCQGYGRREFLKVGALPDLPRDVIQATTEGKPIPGLL